MGQKSAESFFSVFAQLPEDYTPVGLPNDPAFVFSRVQRTTTWDAEGPVLGADGRAYLRAHHDLALPAILSQQTSRDGATKFVLALGAGADGKPAEIECVHMPRDVKNARVTLCISSQVGCGMGCTFCATGTMGYKRNLTAGEIVAQVLTMVAKLGPAEHSRISVVFMGMGEPLQNLDNVLLACKVLSHPKGLGIPYRRITVSTSGLANQIEALGKQAERPLLALSLNATTDAVRSRIMPIGKTWNMQALTEVLSRFPFQKREKLTLEYVLLAGENDTEADALRLAAFAAPYRCNINIIPFNAYEGSGYQEPTEAKLQTFVKALQDAGALATIRRSRGRDVAAACGQLVRLRTAAATP
jgi:23S rRNA (adenine2503-C2)-methyltransferase